MSKAETTRASAPRLIAEASPLRKLVGAAIIYVGIVTILTSVALFLWFFSLLIA